MSNIPPFSQREKQVVAGLLEAKTVKDIACELHLSVNTVKDYLKTIYRKLQVHSARELMLKLGRNTAPPTDTALALLLQMATSFEASPHPQDLAHQLTLAVQRCTRARRASLWRVVRAPSMTYLANDTGVTLRLGSFAERALQRGWARLEPAEQQGLQGRELATAGMSGDAVGIACELSPRAQLLLAADPADHDFGPLDVGIMRLLARIAQASGPNHLRAFRHSA